MRRTSGWWWLAALGALAAVWTGALAAQRRLSDFTHERLVRRSRERIAASSDHRAARLVLQLAADDAWLAVLVGACTDRRQSVARAGEVAVEGQLQRWSALPAQEAAPKLAELARLLAQHAPQMTGRQRDAAQSLAQRLLDRPVDSTRINAARFIADCEAVLRLPSAAADDIRLAALPPALPSSPPAVAAPPVPPAALQPLQTPATPIGPLPAPAALPDANRERPSEPLPLPKAKAKPLKISDDE
jgi:hypothetical protein